MYFYRSLLVVYMFLLGVFGCLLTHLFRVSGASIHGGSAAYLNRSLLGACMSVLGVFRCLLTHLCRVSGASIQGG